MQPIIGTKTAARHGSIHWLGALSASVASFVSGVRPTLHLGLAAKKHSIVFSQRALSPWAAPAFGMLVESDVSRKSGSMVP